MSSSIKNTSHSTAVSLTLNECLQRSVVFSNWILKSKNNMSITAVKLFFFLVSTIYSKERKGEVALKEREYTKKDLEGFIKSFGKGKKKSAGEKVNAFFDEVSLNRLNIKEKGEGNKYRSYQWFSYYQVKDGVFSFKFNKDIEPIIINLTGDFHQFKLYEIISFTSIYSPKLFELVLSTMKLNKVLSVYTLDELRELLLFDKELYTEWKEFKRGVLSKAISEINRFTNIVIHYKTKREGKKITVIEFFAIEKKDKYKFTNYMRNLLDLSLKEKTYFQDFKEKYFLANWKFSYLADSNIILIHIPNIVFPKTREIDSLLINFGLSEILKKNFRYGVDIEYCNVPHNRL